LGGKEKIPLSKSEGGVAAKQLVSYAHTRCSEGSAGAIAQKKAGRRRGAAAEAGHSKHPVQKGEGAGGMLQSGDSSSGKWAAQTGASDGPEENSKRNGLI